MKRLAALIPVVLIFAACNRKKDYAKIFNDPNLYCNTVHELNTIVMGNNFSPMVASRNYLYAALQPMKWLRPEIPINTIPWQASFVVWCFTKASNRPENKF